MTILVMAAIAFFGCLAYKALPVSDLPEVQFPTIEVTVMYPGADPETIANNVVMPLEQQFATIEGIKTISSTSYSGSATIVLIFLLDKSIDVAGPDVQAAINAATPHLPKDLPYAPIYRKFNPTASPILFFSLSSSTMRSPDMYEYAFNVLGEQLSIIDGVAKVDMYGVPYAVRLQVDPQKLAARNISIDEFGSAIQNANVYLPVGTLFGPETEYNLSVNGQIVLAEDYETLIIKNDNGAITRVRDVGRALYSLENDKYYLYHFTKDSQEPMVGFGIIKQNNANTLATIKRVNEALDVLQKDLPGSVKLWRTYDQTDYIEESLHDVQLTLLIALILVVSVIFLYLGKARDTLIPSIVIPLSIVGTFIVMYQLGFTIDILSLLAITLSIGFLVDDAIVVLENIVRHVENGEQPLEASIKGSKEISFTILSMTLCLIAVFIPFVFMGGIIGKILHEFALTIVTVVLFSGVISLSLTPLLCSRLIPAREKKTEKKTWAERFSERFNSSLVNYYKPSLNWVLNNPKITLSVGVIGLLLTVVLMAKLPKDFLPNDDIGFLEGFAMAQDGTSVFKTADYLDAICKIANKNPYVKEVVGIGGTIQDNEGVFYLRLVDIHKRPSSKKIIANLYKELSSIVGVKVFLKPVPLINLQVGTTESKGDYQYTMHSLSDTDLYKYAPIMENKLKQLKGFKQVTSDLDMNQPRLKIEIQRDRASLLGISAQNIEQTLSLAFGTINLSPINTPANQYYVIMEVLPEFYKDPSKLSQIWLKSQTGQLVPLSTVVKMTETTGPLTINHVNGLPSATISFNLEGLPLSSALTMVDQIASTTLPSSVFGVVQGTADIFKNSFANLNFLLIITLFVIYVILGILYENFFHPITVMSTLPPAALGGLLTLLLFGETLSLYAFVGIVLLLGIVMKNGIIMIDFANDAVLKEGKSPREAIYHACLIRFRPILMTTISAIMGAVPIAIGIGGITAQGRRPLGLVIVGGLIFSQILTLYLTPVTYVYLEKLRERLLRKKPKPVE